jgi:diguanylate cyclase (GGDEF)-like protein
VIYYIQANFGHLGGALRDMHMTMDNELLEELKELLHKAAMDTLDPEGYRELCTRLHVTKMYYDMDLGGDDRYRNHRTGELVLDIKEVDRKLVLFDSGKKSGFTKKYTYYYYGYEYVHAYIEFEEGIREEDLDTSVYDLFADVIYLLASRQNMRQMLDHAETSDALTGIPNISFVQKKYYKLLQNVSPQELLVLRINLRNFKYVNEVAGASAGDEAVIQYSRKLIKFVEEDECVGRLGGDNFVAYIHKENLNRFLKKVSLVTIAKLKTAPDNQFDVGAWVGVSSLAEDENKTFLERLNDANVACGIGKSRLKQDVVFFGEDLNKMIMQGRYIIGAFPTAVKEHEFMPFFQPKIDMRTGKLVGFEALCRWFHDGHFIYPDQFIPVLDREGLIPTLDITIFDETCKAIKRWKEMGLKPPRVSSNFSKKNLFVPKIENRIIRVMEENGLVAEDVEIEITESMKDLEYDRLIRFVDSLKERGLFISIDDFGTGYSSLSLLYNIEADVIKIDKAFTDSITTDKKAAILIESIISIAKKLNMETIAEGVETREQGKMLLDIGCNCAQGYYYSKPVDYQTATEMIRRSPFEPI